MKNLLLISCFVTLAPLILSYPSKGQQPSNQTEWITLFNGEDLTGWYTYQRRPEPTSDVDGLSRDSEGNYLEPIGLNRDPLQVFTVIQEDDEPAIRISGETFGILVTNDEYENYHLRLQFKWGDEKYPPREDLLRDSGILYHSIGKEGAWGGVWMKSLECQVMVENTGDFIAVDTTMATIPARENEGDYIYDPSFERELFDVENAVCNHNEDHELAIGEWNTLEIYTVDGNSVHVVNGYVNMRIYNSQFMGDGSPEPLRKGKIQLQSEGAEIYYRNIELQHIDEIPEELR